MPDITIEEHSLGISWTVNESMQRACHALVADGRVWFVDPVDAGEAVERAEALGEPAAVLQLLDRHNRDCVAVAERLGVPHLRVPDAVPNSPFEVLPVVRFPLWKETALWWPERRALVVAEVVGANQLYTAGQGPLGIHPLLRLMPPGSLRAFEPEHLLVGHGPSLHGSQTAAALDRAYARSRRDIPHLLRTLPRLRG